MIAGIASALAFVLLAVGAHHLFASIRFGRFYRSTSDTVAVAIAAAVFVAFYAAAVVLLPPIFRLW